MIQKKTFPCLFCSLSFRFFYTHICRVPHFFCVRLFLYCFVLRFMFLLQFYTALFLSRQRTFILTCVCVCFIFRTVFWLLPSSFGCRKKALFQLFFRSVSESFRVYLCVRMCLRLLTYGYVFASSVFSPRFAAYFVAGSLPALVCVCVCLC